ncbi:MAG TPA: DUF4499 domain-containing protein [Candidatus Binataceae bacterium]|jgi:hypothetical protein|nr:DUF4499 domain-containing protein [Candidatus Binataceae bacterium]
MEIIEIPERDWLKVGFYWMALGLLATAPGLRATWAGVAARWLFDITVVIHVIEALWSLGAAPRAGADRRTWAMRTLFLGYFATRRLSELAAQASR